MDYMDISRENLYFNIGAYRVKEPAIGYIHCVHRLVFVAWGGFIPPLLHFFINELHVFSNNIKWRPVRDSFKLFSPL